MKTIFAVALLAIAMLCACALAQETAEDWYKKGQELKLNDSGEEAAQAYDEATQLDPLNPEYWSDKALNLLLLHRNQEAKESFEKALELYNNTLQKNPEDIDAWMGEARAFNNMAFADRPGQKNAYREAALYSYDQVLQIDPQNASALSLKGGALFELGRHAEAIEALDRALEIGFPPSQEWMAEGTLQIKGLALAAIGKDNESEKSYQETLKGFDEDIENADTSENLSQAWLSKGFILQEQGKYEESIKALDNATDANPKNEMAWQTKAQILGPNLGRYNESLEACDKALDIDTENPDSWRLKGLILMNLGRDEEALSAFEKSIELDPQNGYAWYLKGNLLQRLGHESEAEAAFERGKELGFTSPLAGMMAITDISAEGEDEFIEIANNLDEAKNLKGWTLVVDEDVARSVVLPEYILEPAAKVTVHFGAGEDAGSDLFMNSEISLNDDAANVTLMDEAGSEVSFLGFENLDDGGVAMRTRGSGEFEY